LIVRLRTLRSQIERLKARRDGIIDTIDDEPAAPSDTLHRLRAYLHETLTNGTSTEHMAAIEASIAEVRITEQGSSPCSRSPAPHPIADDIAKTATSREEADDPSGGLQAMGAPLHHTHICDARESVGPPMGGGSAPEALAKHRTRTGCPAVAISR